MKTCSLTCTLFKLKYWSPAPGLKNIRKKKTGFDFAQNVHGTASSQHWIKIYTVLFSSNEIKVSLGMACLSWHWEFTADF